MLLQSWILSVLLVGLASAASALEIEWVGIGSAGNACEVQSQGCFGDVSAIYRIGKYEIANAQYAEFLNAVADDDTYGLYNTAMGSGFGGIARSGSPGSYGYSAIAGREDMPVSFVSFYDALRFANGSTTASRPARRAPAPPRTAPTRSHRPASPTTRSRATRVPASGSPARTSGTRPPTSTRPSLATSSTRPRRTTRLRVRRRARCPTPRTATTP